MSFKKKITFIILAVYFFLSTGINNYAFCMGLCDGHSNKTRIISCLCCKHKIQFNKLDSNQNSCKCSKNQKLPISGNIQSTTNSIQDLAYIENSCNKIGLVCDSIIFKEILYNKINPNQILISNKNLEMLRTVILLN